MQGVVSIVTRTSPQLTICCTATPCACSTQLIHSRLRHPFISLLFSTHHRTFTGMVFPSPVHVTIQHSTTPHTLLHFLPTQTTTSTHNPLLMGTQHWLASHKPPSRWSAPHRSAQQLSASQSCAARLFLTNPLNNCLLFTDRSCYQLALYKRMFCHTHQIKHHVINKHVSNLLSQLLTTRHQILLTPTPPHFNSCNSQLATSQMYKPLPKLNLIYY